MKEQNSEAHFQGTGRSTRGESNEDSAMTRSGRTTSLARIVAAGMLVLICAAFGTIPSITVTENNLPPDPQQTCVVTPTMFASWFHSGAPTLNGLVNPANSLTFSNVPNCAFYQWSENMFLWFTSPIGSNPVFRTGTFFDVSPPDPVTGTRTFIPHPSSPVLDVEQGQADNSVLEGVTTPGGSHSTPGGSLVYYLTSVNDVYAYLATALKDNALSPAPTSFPTNQTELNQITAFAASHGITFPDPNALAIVVKSSWVLASSIPNPQDYVTTTATVLTYDTTNPNQWVPNGQQTVQLALIGVNFFGSANGHPEGIWASFEHMTNAPRGEYTYINTSSQTVTVDQLLGTTNWVLTTNNSLGPFNTDHMFLAPNAPAQPNIDSAGSFTVSPSDTIRWKAFGAASDGRPNPLDASTAASNTEIISLNNSIIGQLIGPDVRANYVMTGATWTEGGAAPTCSFQLGSNCNVVGTSVLASATTETYEQGVDNTLKNGGTVCFTCHLTNQLQVSHDFGNLQPLTSFTQNHGYTISSFPFNLFADAGEFNIVTSKISVIPFNDFNQIVTFSVSDLPPGVIATFDPGDTPSTRMLTLMVSPQTPAGVSTVTVLSHSGELTNFTTLSLTVSNNGSKLRASASGPP